MELPPEASQFVLDGQADPLTSTYRLHKVAEAARSGVQSLVDLVKNLRVYLIADDGDTRARATLLLAKVWLHETQRHQPSCGLSYPVHASESHIIRFHAACCYWTFS